MSGDDEFLAALVTVVDVTIAVAVAAYVDVAAVVDVVVAAVVADESIEIIDSELSFECEAVGQQIVE